MRFGQLACLSSFLIAVYLNVCVCQGVNCNNCCSNTTYKEINEPRRSIRSVWQSGQRALCDRGLRSGWYRFTSDAGGKVMMPENTVPEYHCGTHDPIWLNGRHPTVAEGNVVRQACINSFGFVCDDTLDINVKNCGDYYVYYLKTVGYCAVAYCAGDMIPCPYGKIGVHPNCYDPPTDFSSDYLGVPTITYLDDKEVEVSLVCEASILKGIETWLNVTYRIEWFAEGKSLKSEVVCGGLLPGEQHNAPCQSVVNAKVHSTLGPYKYKIGQWIVCNVSAMFTTSPKNVWSPTKNVRVPFFAGLKGSLCPENTTKWKPRSCVDHFRNGANHCGYYKIYDSAGNGFTVYCDMETEPGAAWTLVVSWSLKHKDFSSFRKTPLSVNDPVNENSPNWFLYRLTADRMKSLKAVSTHWRATCSFDKHGINNYEDYIRGQFAEADILASLGAGVCLKTELVNIRGHIGIHKTARFWQVLNTYYLHIDSSSKGCQFDPTVGAVSSEDNFGFYDAVNPKFTCTVNEDSTTQWWFGGYQ